MLWWPFKRRQVRFWRGVREASVWGRWVEVAGMVGAIAAVGALWHGRPL